MRLPGEPLAPAETSSATVTATLVVTSTLRQSYSATLCGMVRPTWNRLTTSASVLTSSAMLSSSSGWSNATRSGCSTLTVMVTVVLLPAASVAVQVEVLAPKLLPGIGVQVTG